MMQFILQLWKVTLLVAVVLSPTVLKAAKPNILIVLFDDLGDESLFTPFEPQFSGDDRPQYGAQNTDQNKESNPPGPAQDQRQTEYQQDSQYDSRGNQKYL